MNRREAMKYFGVLSITGGFMGPRSVFAESFGSTVDFTEDVNISGVNKEEGKSIYDTLGVVPIINCRGTFTIIGGSTERPEVFEAMESSSGYFVQYDELADGIGKRLSEITKADWGMVSSGCAAGLKLVTAACVTGGNPEKLIRIPDLTGFEKTEVIIPRDSRNVYDHGIRNIGVDIVTVDSPEEMRRAINSKTAMIYIMTHSGNAKGQPFSLEVISEIARPYKVPILVDAAAEDLTIPCVHLERGATIVAYSGGKAICGPQCAGLLLGNKDILMAAWQASSPHHGPGRDNKVGKEEMLGMLAAVEAWTKRDHKAEWNTWLSWLEDISSKVTKIKGVRTEVVEPKGLSNRSPRLIIKWDSDELNITGEEIAEIVARTKPRIAIGSRSQKNITSVDVTPSQMRPGQSKIVADRLYELLSEDYSSKSEKLKMAKVDLNGSWDVEIEYFTENESHLFFLEQEGNWIKGVFKSKFSTQEVIGIVEGNEVKLRSDYRAPGNSINYWFSGKVADEGISGSVFLGEYLTAKFTAKRFEYNRGKERVVIPSGAPLAT